MNKILCIKWTDLMYSYIDFIEVNNLTHFLLCLLVQWKYRKEKEETFFFSYKSYSFHQVSIWLLLLFRDVCYITCNNRCFVIPVFLFQRFCFENQCRLQSSRNALEGDLQTRIKCKCLKYFIEFQNLKFKLMNSEFRTISICILNYWCNVNSWSKYASGV